MADSEDTWPRLIQGLRDGDSLIVREFCNQYGDALHRLADRHLAAGLRRRVGPEDVVQSACRTFLRRAQVGEFHLTDSEALWAILCAITLTKVREQARFHQRQKRGLDREVGGDGIGWDLVGSEPTPAQAAELADQLQLVLGGLDEEERQLVDLKLQECTNEETAERMGCSERTVRRLLKRVQGRLARSLDVPRI